ncbi:MAG: hypothetical protein ABSG44_19950 [Thermodesulfobacteriota bacterium]
MLREAGRELVNEFLSNLKTALEQKRFKFDLKLIGKHLQLYRFYVKNRTHFLFIHASRDERWEIPPPRIEIPHPISSENMDWAVVLLKEPEAKNHLLGFLILGDDFIKMKAGFSMNRMGLIKIREKDLSLKYQFNNWDTFFQLLNLKLEVGLLGSALDSLLKN